MNERETVSILHEWNFWSPETTFAKKFSKNIERGKYLNRLLQQVDLQEVSTLVGVRRCGKSTLGLQVLKKIIESGVDPANTLYINFEEPRLSQSPDINFLVEIFDLYLEQIAKNGKKYVFFDEIQNITGWEKFVRSLVDKKMDIKIFVSGSSSKLLSRELGTKLTGRFITNEIFPLGFDEYLDFKNLDAGLPKGQEALLQLRSHLRRYMETGGFPQAVLSEDDYLRVQLLQDYFESIVLRDVALRYEIRDTHELRNFALLTISRNAKLWTSYKASLKTADQQQSELSAPTANKYLDYLAEAYLLFVISRFDFSLKKQTRYPRKVFAIDPGMFNAVAFKSFAADAQKLEQIVFLALRRQTKDVYYWQGVQEVDFVYRDSKGELTPVNVCWDIAKESTKTREITSLSECMDYLRMPKAKLITFQNSSEKLILGNKKIEVINILDFLLGGSAP